MSFLGRGDRRRSLGAVSLTVSEIDRSCKYQCHSTHSLFQQRALWSLEGGRRGVMT